MKHTDIYDILNGKVGLGQTVTVCGWVRTFRDSATVAFLEVADGTSFSRLQAVVDKNAVALDSECAKNGASVCIKGEIVKAYKGNGVELNAREVTLLGKCPPEYPIQKKRTTLEFLRSIPHLRLRTNTFTAVFRVRSVAAQAIHRYFHENRYYYMNTPIITASDCEGAGEMFRVSTLDPADPPKTEDGAIDYTKDFFGKPASLTVSGQLEGEAMAMAFGQIYTFGPTFRAENSNTTRHAAEFWMIEPEIAFADLQDDMDLARDMIKYVLNEVLNACPDEMKFFNDFYDKELIQRLKDIINSDFAKVTYTEAVEILEKHKEQFKYPVYWGADLQTEHERFLTEQVFKKPLFVTDYPKEIKAFYMRLNDDGKTVAAVDLLVPGVGEIIGGSQREERLDVLLSRMKELGLREEDYSWYLDLRRYGGTKHAGFGLGFERLIMYITAVGNIRDVIPFPRTVGNAEY